MSVNKMVGIKPPSPQKIWRFSSAHFYREVISQINNLWYNILEVIIKGWVVDHRERAESIVSWSGLHLKYNAIFFYAGAGESASCQFFAASSERSATLFTPRVQWKLWKVHLNYPIDTCGDCGRTTQKGYVEILEFTHFVEFFSFNRIAENHKEKELVRKVTVVVALDLGCGNTNNSE